MNMRRSGGAAGLAGAAANAAAIAALQASAGAYLWSWAGSAARRAQTVTAAQVGARGLQTDIQQEFVLRSVSPSVWVEVPSGDTKATRLIVAIPNSNSYQAVGLAAIGSLLNGSGTAVVLRQPAAGTRGTTAFRNGVVCPATAGQNLIIRSLGAAPAGLTGARWVLQWVAQAISPNMRWVAGLITTGPFGTAISTATNIAAVGREPGVDTNMQFYYNDGAGAASKVDLGATLPGALVIGNLYQLELYQPAGGASLGFRIQDLDAGSDVSGVVSTDVPVWQTNTTAFELYADNGADATALGLDWVIGAVSQLAQ